MKKTWLLIRSELVKRKYKDFVRLLEQIKLQLRQRRTDHKSKENNKQNNQQQKNHLLANGKLVAEHWKCMKNYTRKMFRTISGLLCSSSRGLGHRFSGVNWDEIKVGRRQSIISSKVACYVFRASIRIKFKLKAILLSSLTLARSQNPVNIKTAEYSFWIASANRDKGNHFHSCRH